MVCYKEWMQDLQGDEGECWSSKIKTIKEHWKLWMTYERTSNIAETIWKIWTTFIKLRGMSNDNILKFVLGHNSNAAGFYQVN